MATPSNQKHLVAYPVEQWGHTRPLANLCTKFVRLDPALTVSILTTNQYLPRVVAEVAKGFGPDEGHLARSIRIIAVGEGGQLVSPAFEAGFKDAWTKLVAEQDVVCTQTGTRYTAIARPSAAVVDIFAVSATKIIREVSGNEVKVYCWLSGMTTALFPMFVPESFGGKGNIRARAEEEAKRTGKPFPACVGQLMMPTGKLMDIPGLPPMYDYEIRPQDFPLPMEAANIIPRIFETMGSQDGLLLNTGASYESEAIARVKAWYAEEGRAAYACGPLLPTPTEKTAEPGVPSKDAEIEAFLESTLKASGEKSLLYISLGSVYWPAKTPDRMWALLDVIMELQIPFILGHASKAAVVPDEIRAKVAAYGKGVISPWTPQQTILDHPVTGWFVSHGGHNSVLESIAAGVPMILWPFGADQSHHGARLSVTLDAGYELLEVRTGEAGLKPLHRTGAAPRATTEAAREEAREVLQKAFGPDGARKRANLRAVQRGLLGEWEEGGASLGDVRAFLATL